MADQKQLRILLKGAKDWNQWRAENDEVEVDLREANLHKANLEGANLSRVNLHDANLRRANLRGANLGRAYLRTACLSRAELGRVDLNRAHVRRADLSRAKLGEADLNGANLSRANLSEADLNRANLRRANLSKADLSGANLSEADLSRANLVETNLEHAILTGCHVYGVSAWNVRLNQAEQKHLVITQFDEPAVMVDDLEVAQFVYLLLHHDKLRNVLNAVTEKGVLILGRFGGGGLEVLRAIAGHLRKEGYLPIIFDFERPRDRTYTETVQTLVGMARFVIVDLSGQSVPQELYATVPHFKLPFVPILESGRKPYPLFPDLLENQNVLDPVEFENQEQLLDLLSERVIAPAEARVAKRQERLAELFGRGA